MNTKPRLLPIFSYLFLLHWEALRLPRWHSGKESPCQRGRHRRHGPDSWRRKWQPTPVFLPGEFHGQRSLAGYGPWGHKDTTEQLTCTFAPCKMGIIILILQMRKLKVFMEMGFHERKKPRFRSCDIWLNHLIL